MKVVISQRNASYSPSSSEYGAVSAVVPGPVTTRPITPRPVAIFTIRVSRPTCDLTSVGIVVARKTIIIGSDVVGAGPVMSPDVGSI